MLSQAHLRASRRIWPARAGEEQRSLRRLVVAEQSRPEPRLRATHQRLARTWAQAINAATYFAAGVTIFFGWRIYRPVPRDRMQ